MIIGIIYNDKNYQAMLNDSNVNEWFYYDSDTQCKFSLLSNQNLGENRYYLNIVDESVYNMRGFNVTEIHDIVRDKFNLMHNEHVDISSYVKEFWNRHINAFYREPNKNLVYNGIEKRKYDYIDFLNVLQSVLIEAYPESGLADVLGVFVFEKRSTFKLNMRIGAECEKRVVEDIPVLFDGEYFYSVYNNMIPEVPYDFIMNMVRINNDIKLGRKSVLPKRFTRALSNKLWFYLTGRLMPDIGNDLEDIVYESAEGDTSLLQNPEFKRYIYNKHITMT